MPRCCRLPMVSLDRLLRCRSPTQVSLLAEAGMSLMHVVVVVLVCFIVVMVAEMQVFSVLLSVVL